MWADDMLDICRGPVQTNKGLQLATMTGPDSCRVGNLELAAEDLLVAEHLTRRVCTVGPDGEYDGSIRSLGAGDTVVICQISDTRFLILERVVTL